MNPEPDTTVCRTVGAALLATVLAAGCATAPAAPPPPYDELAREIRQQTEVDMADVGTLKRAFLAAPDFDQRIRAATALEDQATVLMTAAEPLRLGPVGAAILDHYSGSIVGHRALAGYYRHVAMPEQAAMHESWVAAISARMESRGDGGVRAPYPALSPNEAKQYLAARGDTVLGATYHETEDHPFMFRVAATRKDGRVGDVFFDVGDLYSALAESAERKPTTVFPVGPPFTCESLEVCEDFSRWEFIQILARGGDSAAQTLIGVLAGDNLDAAAEWFEPAVQSGNALASLFLGDLLSRIAPHMPDEERERVRAAAEQALLFAIRVGLDDAMQRLGQLYLRGSYGEGKVPMGLRLIERAAELDNPSALVALGGMHVDGRWKERDHDLAEKYLLRAAERDEGAKLAYANFLMHPEVERDFNQRAYRWLREVADNDNPAAMVLIGDLYAKGVHVGRSSRRAQSWFKNAVEAAPDDPYFVNEVAWRLTVTHLPRLRDEPYALAIMERIMEESEEARRNPAYLDTWAAAYAANGDFEQAIRVQEQAVEQAQAGSADDLPTLLEHLEAFRANQKISYEVP